MSGRRWGIGLVTVVVAVAVALSSIMATIVVLYSLCESSQHGPGPPSTTCAAAPPAPR